MQLSNIQTLFNYNYWANQRILHAASGMAQDQFEAQTPHCQGSLHTTLLHTLDAEYGWRMLCQHGQPTDVLRAADFPTLAHIVARWREEEQAMHDYLGGLTDADLTADVVYTVNDAARQRVLWHCLWHVVNHGTQHRSEAAAILTSFGRSPGELDFTIFLSQQH